MMDKDAIAKDVESISQVIQDNSAFLLANIKDGYNEVVEFIQDAWDFDVLFIKKGNWDYYYNKFSMVYFGSHVLLPLSFAIRVDLLLSNIPACFFELRLILESMGKCYFSDLRYKEQVHFMEKLESLEKKMNSKKSKTSISRLLREMGPDYEALWKRLSEEWLHTESFVRRILEETLRKGDIPAYALASPISYNEADIDIIRELCASVSKFRALLKETVDRWNREIGKQIKDS